ncbi:MAG: hypothetical protein QOG57_5777, partial [Pseudonocardiales bacterium]|nr:hypothetical protein [Pseudonocardiales bacterium]
DADEILQVSAGLGHFLINSAAQVGHASEA